ncbi:MAG: hypothetical protein IPM54_34545 [Polyangiaceae bacterium]|nr:hypothetical protein [Polyangiaceae bacterium]
MEIFPRLSPELSHDLEAHHKMWRLVPQAALSARRTSLKRSYVSPCIAQVDIFEEQFQLRGADFDVTSAGWYAALGSGKWLRGKLSLRAGMQYPVGSQKRTRGSGPSTELENKRCLTLVFADDLQ